MDRDRRAHDGILSRGIVDAADFLANSVEGPVQSILDAAFAVILAGYVVGRDVERGDMDFATPSTLLSTDMFLVVALLAVGYYLAVHLSFLSRTIL